MTVATHPTTQQTPTTRSVGAVVAGSLAAGLGIALVLVLLIFTGATEAVVTGSFLLGLAVGWAMLAVLSQRLTSQPQRWAAVPAAVMGVAGLALMALAPQDAALTALSWVWPPAMMSLVAWMFVQVRRSMSGRGRLLVTPVLVVLAAATVGATVENLTVQRDEHAYPAPGRLYDVGGHRLHLDCRGEGSPTVVLFNGLGEISASWARITDEVGGTTRVCAYDRAGQGWSDDVASPQDGIEAAADLHALLADAGEAGPFILAGHSIGGTYALTYAAQYPDQVAGMALLDSSSPEQFTRVPSYPMQYAAMRRGLAVLPTLARLGLGHLTASTSLTGADAGRVMAMISTARAARNGRDELSMIPTLFEQARALTTLSGRPLAVLTSSEQQVGTDGWAAAQDALAALSDNRVHREVESSHAGMVDDPHAALESARAIEQVVAAVRAGAPLTTH